MAHQICEYTKKKMKNYLRQLEEKLKKIQVHRISIDIFNNILVKYYNKLVPLNQLAYLAVENSRTLIISVFEKKMVHIVEKAITSANLEVNISVLEKKKIRVSILPITEKYRKKIVKLIRTEIENGKISIRNIRRESNEKIKSFLKKNIISRDEDRMLQKNIQDITDFYIKNLNDLLENKEKEIRAV